jgi:hypothetical protein
MAEFTSRNPFENLMGYLAIRQRERSDERDMALQKIAMQIQSHQNELQRLNDLKISRTNYLSNLEVTKRDKLNKLNELRLLSNDVAKEQSRNNLGGESASLVGNTLSRIASEVESIDNNIDETKQKLNAMDKLQNAHSYGYAYGLSRFNDIVGTDRVMQSNEIMGLFDKLENDPNYQQGLIDRGFNIDAVKVGITDAIRDRERELSEMDYRRAQTFSAYQPRSGGENQLNDYGRLQNDYETIQRFAKANQNSDDTAISNWITANIPDPKMKELFLSGSGEGLDAIEMANNAYRSFQGELELYKRKWGEDVSGNFPNPFEEQEESDQTEEFMRKTDELLNKALEGLK